MRKWSIFFIFVLLIVSYFSGQVSAEKTDYEKYGRMAIAVVAADYPTSAVKDYQYMGRNKVTEKTVIDSFRFEVIENNQKFFVTVNVVHDLTNDKVLNLTIKTEKPSPTSD